MYISMSQIIGTALFLLFLWWLHSSEEAAKKKKHDQNREFELRQQKREIERTKRSAEMLRKEGQGVSYKSGDQSSN